MVNIDYVCHSFIESYYLYCFFKKERGKIQKPAKISKGGGEKVKVPNSFY